MLTHDDLDASLIEEARRLGGHRTKREAVQTALLEYVQHQKQMQILEAFGTVDFDLHPSQAQRERNRRLS